MELRQFFFKTLILIGTIVALFTLYQVRSILLLFFGAILFASTVRPIVTKLSERGVPALVSILVIYLVFLASLIGMVIILFPTLLTSMQDLVNSQTAILQAIEEVLLRIQTLALNGSEAQVPILRVTELQRYLTEFQASAQENFQAILLDGFRFVSEALILFVMAFYWFTERDHLEQLALRMLRLRHRERFLRLV
jgi:predicted PurR-regulated permease PerM